jgi:hypothetical protein
MKRFLPYYLLTLFIFSFSDCKKDKGSQPDNTYGLPNATQSGLMMFACRMNGQNVISSVTSSQNGKIAKDSIWVFSSFGNADYFGMIRFLVYGNAMTHVQYDLSNPMQTEFSYSTDSTCMGISSNITSVNTALGTLTFSKLDSVKKIISGNFSFKVAVPGCDTLNFTDGRFDIGY